MSDQENEASRFARDMAANAEKMLKATQLIANTRDEDVNIGTTPKNLVMHRDKVECSTTSRWRRQRHGRPCFWPTA